MSNDQWFYTDAQQQQLGPVPFDTIQRLSAAGQIQPTTLVWNESLPNWTAASQVPGIFNAPVATPQSPYQAPAGYGVAPVGSNYPAPFVKKTSFGLYLGAYLAAFILMIIVAVSMMAVSIGTVMASGQSPLDLREEEQQLERAETVEEREAIKERIEQKQRDFSTELSAGASAGIGIGFLGILAAWGLSIFAAVYGYIILYRAWHILQPGGARTTPGQAVGFMFIPIFNIYWIFNAYVGWSTDWNRIRSSYPDLKGAPAASGGIFIAGLVCVFTVIASPVGLILILIGVKQMCDTINFFATRQLMGSSTGNMPKLV